MTGQILGGRYELLEKIGGGGMAIVYKAKCNLLNRFVAVKILRSEFTNDEEFVKRFRVEAQAAASLSHPNIVSIYDVGREDGIHYIVMEYIDGITLKEYILQKSTLPWKEATNIAIQICSAIEQAHRNHIVHRDIKPHNILITKDGIAKVTDFGIAKAVSSSTITMVGSTIGSVHYFSPEQARGGFTDEKSDLYSLGIVLYEMVTGKTPFDGETPVAVALKHIQVQAPPPMEINSNIPKGINDIIMKAIMKEQNSRYQSASEMLADLHRVFSEPNGGFVELSGGSDDSPTMRIHEIGDGSLLWEKNEHSGEERDDGMKGKKKDRITVWLAAVTSLVIISIFAYIGYKIVIPAIMPEPDSFVVEYYVGRDFEEVKQELQEKNIGAEETPVFNDNTDKGIIISQSVAQGKEFKSGGNNSITFEVSAGPEMIKIPDEKNKDYRTAETDLKNLNLVTKTEDEYNEDVPYNLVIRTEPDFDEEVKPESTVTIYKSIGPKLQQVEVPDLTGKTYDEAQQALSAAKLKVGKVTPENVSSVVSKVISQFPLAKTMVEEGSAVNLTFGDETGTGAGTQNENTATGGTQNENTAGKTTARKTVYQPLVLDDSDKYGDEIKVYVEATPSDTNNPIVVLNKTLKKSEFPLTLPIKVPENGSTLVRVMLDDVQIAEFPVS